MSAAICTSLLLLTLAISMAVGIGQLLELYRLTAVPWGSLDPEAAMAVLHATKAALLAWLFWHRGGPRHGVMALAIIAAIAGVLGASLLLAPELFPGTGGGLVSAMMSRLMGGTVAVVLGILLGVGYLGLSAALLASRDPLNGYQIPLAAGSMVTGISLVLVFVDTFIHLSGLFLDLSLLLFALSRARAPRPRLCLPSLAWAQAYTVAGLGLPLALFLGHKLYLLGAMVMTNEDLLVALLEETTTPMQEVVPWDEPATHVPAGARRVHRRVVLNDVWFLSPQRALGVSESALHESTDGGRTWQRARSLRTSGERLRFAADGQRGWTGEPWWAVELTRDGGASWSRLELEALYLEQTGKELDSAFLSGHSPLRLDPDSGHGSVVMNCRFFRTRDFALTWEMTEISGPESKRICLAESPLALDDAAGLALGASLGSELLYRKDPDSGAWMPRCGRDAGAMLAGAPTLCDDEGDLSDTETAFLARVDSEHERSGQRPPADELMMAIFAGETLPPRRRPGSRSTGGGFRWLAAPGVLLTSADDGARWQVHQHIPALITVHPWDENRAVGWDEFLTPYLSTDGGNVWRALAIPESESVLDLRVDPDTRALWVLTHSGLLRMDPERGAQRWVQRWPDGEGFEHLGIGGNGRRLWLHTPEHHRIQISDDRGEGWHEFDLSDPDRFPLVDVHCAGDEDPCLVILHDGQVLRLDAEEPSAVGWLPDDAVDEPGFLLSHGSPRTYVFIPQEGRKAYVSGDGGASWDDHSLATRQAWSRPRQSQDGSSLLLPGEDGAVLLGELDAPWITVLPSDWDDTLHACWSATGNTLYLYDEQQLAWTLDAGTNWRRVRVEDGVPPFCGFGGEHLWLQLQDMRVYRLRDS